MSLDGDRSTDDYIVTALQIFHYCGANSTSTLRVDELMDKFAPFVKTNKTEYSYLRSLLDPDQSNPEVTVSMLASTLHKYSENQKVKVDLDESFNLKSGQVPHDSDSGISTDGFHLLEELQCELREKSHLAQQLRTQLDYSDRHHEEALAAVTAERDTLRAHLNMLREESSALSNVRRDYEEACERLVASDRALDVAQRDLEAARRRARVLTDQVALLETEKLTLQELLSKSKEECHRINDMYASRQATLLEENETLRTEHADVSARLQDQEEFMQQIIKEKVLLEMELKDLLNKSNQTHLRFDRSIDVSYTEDQMLTALDSLNADSRFAQEGRLLDEESFIKALREDQGRATNMSLFDEIRLSFNLSRHNITDLNCTPTDKQSELNNSLIAVATQTDNLYIVDTDEGICKEYISKNNETLSNTSTQTEMKLDMFSNEDFKGKSDILTHQVHRQIHTYDKSTNTSHYVLEVFKDIEVMNFGTQTDLNNFVPCANNGCVDYNKCSQCENLNKYIIKLEAELKLARTRADEMQWDLDKYEENLNVLQKSVIDENDRNNLLNSVVDNLKVKLEALEDACDNLKVKLEALEDACSNQSDKIEELYCSTCSEGIQTDSEQSSVSTQAEMPCANCVKRNASQNSVRRYLWEPLKCLFQLFAVLCFICALTALCGVTRRRRAACRDPLPWHWLQPHDLIDLLLSVEYVADVPM